MKKIKRSTLLKKLGNITSVENLISNRSGRGVANQFLLRFQNGSAFQSYDSLIAVWYDGKWYLTNDHDYSSTTSKYCTQWMGVDTATRRKCLESGTYISITD